MLTSPIYQPSDEEIDALVAAHPFALIISGAGETLQATPAPLLLERESDGERVLVGHFGLRNPQIAQLQSAPSGLVVFQGVHGYVSPSWLSDRTQAPTWNFATVHFGVEVVFEPEFAAALSAVERLSAIMEEGRARAWSPAEMGQRRDKLAAGVIAFRARVTTTCAKFKLGQNERSEILTEVLAALRLSGEEPLHSAMLRANAKRVIEALE